MSNVQMTVTGKKFRLGCIVSDDFDRLELLPIH